MPALHTPSTRLFYDPGGRMGTKPKLLDQMRHVLRLKHMSIRTEETYLSWAKRFILFHGKRHPQEHGCLRNPRLPDASGRT